MRPDPLEIQERWLPALRELGARGTSTPVLELAFAAWALPYERPVPALLREVGGAADLADDDALTTAVAERLPALRAGHIDI
ncbi:hypothetical protein [Streptomyces sp. NPDC048419]|uniref:hypothetical protein n=1 Tax=Streptomyces sp. NPDC048419 TaxID=3365547 RepID=UPI003718D1BC